MLTSMSREYTAVLLTAKKAVDAQVYMQLVSDVSHVMPPFPSLPLALLRCDGRLRTSVAHLGNRERGPLTCAKIPYALFFPAVGPPPSVHPPALPSSGAQCGRFWQCSTAMAASVSFLAMFCAGL